MRARTCAREGRLERCKAPDSIIIDEKADLERLDEANVGAQHFADGLRPAQFEQRERRQDGVNVGQIGTKVVEDSTVLGPGARDDVAQRLWDIAAAERILERRP